MAWAVASILSQLANKRVLVLESHWRLGGFLHSFKRKGYEWDPGFHYIGEMQPGSLTRGCMDLVTDGRVAWQQMEENFERFIFPETTFDVPSSADAYKQRLKERFPAEAGNIDTYFKDLMSMQLWNNRWYYSKLWAEPIAGMISSFGRKKAEMLTQDYLDERFSDPTLKAIVAAQWGDQGAPPGRSPFGIHAMVAADFLNGGYYPTGGSQLIADTIVDIVEENGGRCLASHPVSEILIKNNKAYGVTVENRKGSKQFFAPIIVSAAGIDKTFQQFVAEPYGQKERRKLNTATPGITACVLYMGIKEDPRKHGFRDCNYWIFDRLNHGYEDKNGAFPPSIGNTTLSFASLRNSAAKQHSAQLVTFGWYDDWKKYNDLPWKKRGEQYENAKHQYTEHLLDFVEQHTPGLRDLISYKELSTPVTMETMTQHAAGQIYGRECTPDRVRDKWSVSTSVKNLYLTGTDLVMPGVNSALMIGVMTAAKLHQPLGLARIFTNALRRKPEQPVKSVSQPTPVAPVIPTISIAEEYETVPGPKTRKSPAKKDEEEAVH